MARARPFRRAPDPLESEIQAAAIQHWRTLGRPLTLVAAIPNQNAHGQPGLTPGLPDLLVMGPDIPGPFPFGFLELKRDHRARLRDEQLDFASLCAKLGILCPTVYGRDEPISYLEKWNVVRPQRYPAAPESRRLELEWP